MDWQRHLLGYQGQLFSPWQTWFDMCLLGICLGRGPSGLLHSRRCCALRLWGKSHAGIIPICVCQTKSPSLQSIRLSTSTHNLGCLRTKKGLQGGKTIQQRSELLFALQWSLMLLPLLYWFCTSTPERSLLILECLSLCQCYYSS